MNTADELLRAALFAARAHRKQKRKGSDQGPYVNHVIKVSHLLAHVGGVDNVALLQAALLHDTVEDTDVTRDELAREFGEEVTAIVMEVTDDKSLPKEERKRLQIEHGSRLSSSAKQLKIADKTSNISELGPGEPPDWTPERRRGYLEWAKLVADQMRGVNAKLEAEFDRILAERRAALDAE